MNCTLRTWTYISHLFPKIEREKTFLSLRYNHSLQFCFLTIIICFIFIRNRSFNWLLQTTNRSCIFARNDNLFSYISTLILTKQNYYYPRKSLLCNAAYRSIIQHSGDGAERWCLNSAVTAWWVDVLNKHCVDWFVPSWHKPGSGKREAQLRKYLHHTRMYASPWGIFLINGWCGKTQANIVVPACRWAQIWLRSSCMNHEEQAFIVLLL